MSGESSPKFKHGFDGKDPIYRVWNHMRDRCYCESDSKYHRYGGRGINICDEWHDFLKFREWALKNGWEKGLSIDRIDNDGPYAPWNCRWTDCKVQANNRSSCVLLTYDGKTQNITQWSMETGIPRHTIYNRYENGWGVERIFKTPYRIMNRKNKKKECD